MGGGERKSTVHFRTGRKWAVDLVQVLPNALDWLCVSIKCALEKRGIKTLKPLISQGFQVSVSILVTQDGHRVYGGSECSTRKHIENTTFLRHKRTGLLRKSNPPLYRTGADLLIGHTELGNSPNTS